MSVSGFQNPVSANQRRASAVSAVFIRAQRLAALEEAAQVQATGAAHLDQRELGHVVLGHRALDDGHRARAVQHHRDHLPGFHELREGARLVVRPRAAHPVGVFLHGVLDLLGALQPVHEVDPPGVG